MGLLPNLGGIDPKETIQDFLAALHAINHKLDVLIDLQREGLSADRLARATDRRQAADAEATACMTCHYSGRLRCPDHGRTTVPTLDSQR